MQVPFSYLDRQFYVPQVSEDPHISYTCQILDDIKDFIRTGDFTLGKKLEEFEEKFAAFVGVQYAIGVNSGTDALTLSLKAAGIGAGDEVITCAETFIATAGAIVAAGATPVFVDVNDVFTIDVNLIEQAITKKTKAILPVWFTGNAPDMKRISEIAARYKLVVIEDSCCAIDASISNQKAGSFGLTGTFSFHPLKNLNVWSDGGMVTTNDPMINKQLRLLRNHGLLNRDEIAVFGYNSRLDTLQAVIALRMLGDVTDVTNRRIANAYKLDEAFKKIAQIEIPKRDQDIRHVFHLYMLRVKNRDALNQYCQKQGIETKVHYPIPLPYQQCSAYLGYKQGDFPKTERDCENIITFPCHQHLTDQEVDFIISTVKHFYESN